MSDGFSRTVNYKISGVERIIFRKNLVGNLPDLVPEYPAVVIADQNTIKLLPKIVFSAKNLKFIVLKFPLPDLFSIDDLKKCTENYKIIIALGSGTITDLCKYLAYITKKKYIVFCTAPSVNAYTSPNASIINYNGKKNSVVANMPHAIYIDENIFYKCPRRLVISGLYDLLCNSTVMLDCLVSHILFGTYYNQGFFDIISSYIELLIKDFRYFSNDIVFRKLLMEALLISGFGMWIYSNSRSASQGEHQIAHLLERKYNKQFFHGELVAVSAIYTSLLQENLFKYKKKAVMDLSKYKKYRSHKKGMFLNSFFDQLQEKLFYYQGYFANFTKNYGDLRNFICKTYIVLPKFDKFFLRCAKTAFLTRERFTCLDLAYLCKLDNMVIK